MFCLLQVFAFSRFVCIVILLLQSFISLTNNEYETLLIESKWGGELAGTERGKCREEGYDLKENIRDRQKKQKEVFLEQMWK